MYRTVNVFKANSIGDEPVLGFVIEAKESISSSAPGESQRVVNGYMERDARALVEALSSTLPQGTWARFVALMARQWADDQQGILSASAWYPGLSRKEVDQSKIAALLQRAYDDMMPGEPGRNEIVAALLLLGVDTEAEE